jgi:hypothetical protein
MAATPPVPAESVDLDSLPSVKLYKLLKDLDARNINIFESADAQFPESFHMLNLDNFDTDTLKAMFADLIEGDLFYHTLQGSRLCFRLVRGKLSYSPPNLLVILGTIKLASVLGSQGVTLSRNNLMKDGEADYDWDELPLSLPPAMEMAAAIKKGYEEDYPKEPFDEAVMEFRTKNPEKGGILIRVVPPTRLQSMAVDGPAAVPAAANPVDQKIVGGKRQRVDSSASSAPPAAVSSVAPAAPTTQAPAVATGGKRVSKPLVK